MKIKILFKQAFALLISLSGLFFSAQAQSAQSNSQHHNSQAYPANSFSDTKLTFKIITASNNTFGYDIYTDGRLLIHQPAVPAMPGNDGFKTNMAAVKVAQLVITKIKKGEMPPAVTIEEMKKLKAIK